MNDPGEDHNRRAIRALVDQYASAADARDVGRFVAVFTVDGTLNGTQFTYVGHDELASIPTKLERYSSTRHLVSDHTVALDGDTASGHTHCVAHHLYEQDGVERDRVLHIRYQDAFVRTPEGWRIASRTLIVDRTEDEPVTPA